MKKNKRIKIPLHTLQTRDDAEAAMNSLALAVNNQRKEIAARDAAILNLQKNWAAQLASYDLFIQEKSDALRAWAEANPAEFPAGRKSIQFPSGTIGFRTGTPKLALLNRKWTWEAALHAVRHCLPAFIRNEPAIDKESLIAQREEPIIAETLPKVGLKVTQDEGFFIDPALTDTDARQVVKSEAA